VIPNNRRVPSRVCKTSTAKAAATSSATDAGKSNSNDKYVDGGTNNEISFGNGETPISGLTINDGADDINRKSIQGFTNQDAFGGEENVPDEVSARKSSSKKPHYANDEDSRKFEREASNGGKSLKTKVKATSSEPTKEKPKHGCAIKTTTTPKSANTAKTASTVASTAADISAVANSGGTKHSGKSSINAPHTDSNHSFKFARKRLTYEIRRSVDEDNEEIRGKVIGEKNGEVSNGDNVHAEVHANYGRARKASKISDGYIKSKDVKHSAIIAKAANCATSSLDNIDGMKVDRASKSEKATSYSRTGGDTNTSTSRASSGVKSNTTKPSKQSTSKSKSHFSSSTFNSVSGKPNDYERHPTDESKRPSRPPSNSTAPSYELPTDTITIRSKQNCKTPGRSGLHPLKVGTKSHPNKNENICIPGFLPLNQLHKIAKKHGGMAIQYRALYHQGDAGPIVDKNIDVRRSSSKKSGSSEDAGDGQSRLIQRGTLIIQSYHINEKGNRGGSNFSFDHWKLPGKVKKAASIYDSTRPILAEEGLDRLFGSGKTRNGGDGRFRPFLAIDPSLSSRDAKRVKTFVKEAQSGDTPVNFFAEKGKVAVAIGSMDEVESDIFNDFDSAEEITEKEITTRVRRERKNSACTPKRAYPCGFLSSYEKARTKSARRKRKLDQQSDTGGNKIRRVSDESNFDSPVTVYFDVPDVDTDFHDPKYFGLIECLGGGCEEIEKGSDTPHRGRLLELPGEILSGRWKTTVGHDAQDPANGAMNSKSEEDVKALKFIRISMRHTSSPIVPLEECYSGEHSLPKKYCNSVSVITPHKNRLKSFIDQGIFAEKEVNSQVEGEECILNNPFLSGISIVSFDGFTSASEAINLADEISSEFLRGINPSRSYYDGEQLLTISRAENDDIGDAVSETKGILFPCKIGFEEEYFVVVSQDDELRVTGIDVIFRSLKSPSSQQNHTASIENIKTNEFQLSKEDFILTDANVTKHLDAVGDHCDEIMDRFEAQRLHLAAISTSFYSDEMQKQINSPTDCNNMGPSDDRDDVCFEDHGASRSCAGPQDKYSGASHENTNVVIPSQIALSTEKSSGFIEWDQPLCNANRIDRSYNERNTADNKYECVETDYKGRPALSNSSSLPMTCTGILACNVRQEPDKKAHFTPVVETLANDTKAAVNVTDAPYPFKRDIVVAVVDAADTKIDDALCSISKDNRGESLLRSDRLFHSSRRVTAHHRHDGNFLTKRNPLDNTMDSLNFEPSAQSQRLHFDRSIGFGDSTETPSWLSTKPSKSRLHSAPASSPLHQNVSDNAVFGTDTPDANAPKSDKNVPIDTLGINHVSLTFGRTSNIGKYLAASNLKDEVCCHGDLENHDTPTNPASHHRSANGRTSLSKTSPKNSHLDLKFDTELGHSKLYHSSTKSRADVVDLAGKAVASPIIGKCNSVKDWLSESKGSIFQRSQVDPSVLCAMPKFNESASTSKNGRYMTRPTAKVDKRFLRSQLSRNYSYMSSKNMTSSSTGCAISKSIHRTTSTEKKDIPSSSMKRTPKKRPTITVNIDDPLNDSDDLFGCRIKSSEKKPYSAKSKSISMEKTPNGQKTVKLDPICRQRVESEETVPNSPAMHGNSLLPTSNGRKTVRLDPDSSICSLPNVVHQRQRVESEETVPNSPAMNGNNLLPDDSGIDKIYSGKSPPSNHIGKFTSENNPANFIEEKSIEDRVGSKSLDESASAESSIVSSLTDIYHQPFYDVYYGRDCELLSAEADFHESQSYVLTSNEPYFHDYYYGLLQCCTEGKSSKMKKIICHLPIRTTRRPKLLARQIILIGAVLLGNFIPQTEIDPFQPTPLKPNIINASSVFECCTHSFEEVKHSANEPNENYGWVRKLYG